MTKPNADNADIEQLMIDALDGTLSPRDYRVLRAHLDRHPDERAMFDQMLEFDRTMRAEAAPVAPATMTQHVMTAIRQAHVAQPALKAPQIAFLIGFPSALLFVITLALIGLYLLVSPDMPQVDIQAGLALLRAMADFVESIVVAVILFLRALYSMPLTWGVTVGLAIVVAGWMRIMIAIWLPRPVSA